MALTSAETRAILRDTTNVFAASDDVAEVAAISRLQKEIQDARDAREQALKQTIREWTARVTKAESEVEPCEDESVHRARLENKEADKFAAAKAIKHADKESQSVEGQVAKLRLELETLRARRRELDMQSAVEVPRTKHSLSLFANLTSIRWDYDSEDVQGYVCSANSADMRPFHLDPKKSSKFFITNYLWDLI